MEPASIRYKNPGAMWGNAIALKWGAAKKAVVLHDGLGQGNNIAVFPTYVQGICAQLDLWRTSKNYKNKRFADAIATWSGHNSVAQYIAFVKKRVPGLANDTVMNEEFWRGDMAVPFLKAQAWHEAGKQYPAPDADWVTAKNRVMGRPEKEKPSIPVVTPTMWATLWATLLAFFEHHRLEILVGGLLCFAGYIAYRVYKAGEHEQLSNSTRLPPVEPGEPETPPSQVEPEQASVPEAEAKEGDAAGVTAVVEVNNTVAPTEDSQEKKD